MLTNGYDSTFIKDNFRSIFVNNRGNNLYRSNLVSYILALDMGNEAELLEEQFERIKVAQETKDPFLPKTNLRNVVTFNILKKCYPDTEYAELYAKMFEDGEEINNLTLGFQLEEVNIFQKNNFLGRKIFGGYGGRI